MRSVSPFLLLCVLFSNTVLAQTVRSEDDAAIRALVRRYVSARNDKDAEATRKVLTADADQLVSTGEWRRGAEALVQGAMASSRKEAGNSAIHVENIRLAGPGVAIVDGRYTATSSNGVTRRMWTTLVVRRTEDGWRIAAIRNMLPAPGH